MHWNLTTVSISDLKKYAKNPRTISKGQFRQLSKSIDRFGLIDKPVLNYDKTIIGGHQRVEVLASKGYKEIECWISGSLLSEKEVEELNIRLNRGGDFDFDILANMFDIGDLLSWGFDDLELGLGKPEKAKKPEKAIISLEFSDKETMFNYMQKLEEIASLSSAKMKVKG